MDTEKKLKKLDRNELIIKWGDLLILNSNHLGEVSRESFMLDWVFTNHPPTQEQVIEVQNDPARKIRDEFFRRLNAPSERFDLINKEMESNLTAVKNHLLSHGYIEAPIVTERFWRISEKGKLMKELGGHKKYIKYRVRELSILKNQNIVNTILIIIAFLSVIVPIFIAYFSTDKTIVINDTKGKYELKQVAPDTLLLSPVLEGKDTVKRISADSLKKRLK